LQEEEMNFKDLKELLWYLLTLQVATPF
jgi:hypothetical protein